MRLNHDLIREIMIEVGNRPSSVDPSPVNIDGYMKADIEEHIYLLVSAGYLEECSFCDCEYYVSRVTWEGQKFLDNIEDPDVWKETKKYVKSRAINASIDILTKIAYTVVSTKMGIN